MAGGDSAEVFGPADESFGQIPDGVKLLVVVDWFFPIFAGWDYRFGVVFRVHQIAKPLRIVTLVGDQGVEFEPFDQPGCSGDIGNLSFTENEPYRLPSASTAT